MKASRTNCGQKPQQNFMMKMPESEHEDSNNLFVHMLF